MRLKIVPHFIRDSKILAIVVLYCLAAWCGFQLSFDNTANVPVWPAAGMGLALLILLGRESWPGIAIGAMITQIYANWNNIFLTPQDMVIIAVLVSLGATLQVIAGNFMYNLFI